jgi:hypothetical protein
MNIEKNGVIYFTKKNKGEVNNMYFDRINLLADSKSKNLKDFLENNRKFEKICNEKILKCIY